MAEQSRDTVRNLAVIAHADHGKTTLVDALLWQSRILGEDRDSADLVMDSIDLEREKVVTVMAPVTSVVYRRTRINIIDTPGRADYGREVERTLKMVEGVMLIVDVCEGPLPQTRFVLRQALEADLTPIVILNKIDQPQARPRETLEEVRKLFVDLEATERQLQFPVLYCDARRGLCRVEPQGGDQPLLPVFEQILQTIPPPRYESEQSLQFQVALFDYDDYLGRLALGRVVSGVLQRGQEVTQCHVDGGVTRQTIGGLFGYDGLRRVEIDKAEPGDIAAVTGVESIAIGESLCAGEAPCPLPPLKIDEATLTIGISVNDSPMAGLDGTFVSADKLRERLFEEILTNVAVRVEETDSPEAFNLSGRGELQLAILLEMLRREGYELTVGKPRVRGKTIDGQRHEPHERLIVDCPEDYGAVVAEKIAARGGRMTKQVDHGMGRVRMEFHIASRGLLGFRSEFLRDTKGTGIMNHVFEGYEVAEPAAWRRATGALVADRPGRATAFAIEHLQPRGTMFVGPGEQVYEGMIVGENSRTNDLSVNITKERRSAPAAGRGAEHAAPRLIPPRSMSLEHALEFIADDELVELTPKALRLRKRILQASRREQH